MKKIIVFTIFLITFIAIASDKNLVCATSACSIDFTPINQFEKIYYTAIDVGTQNLDNINISTVPNESPRSLRLYVENNSKTDPKNLTLDLSSKSQEFNSADGLIIGDYFNNISMKLNGYSGTTGKSASELCADKYLIGGTLGFGDYAKAEFQSKRIANPLLPVNKCTAADVDFLQKNNFMCGEDGYQEISTLDPQVSVKRFKGKTKCLGVGFKDICLQKTVKVKCDWILKYSNGQYTTHDAEKITKYFIIAENEWSIKTDSEKKNLCLSLTKGSDQELDSSTIISNGNFNKNADTWTLSGNMRYVNSKVKAITGPELHVDSTNLTASGSNRLFNVVLGYSNLALQQSKAYTYQVVSLNSNVSCSTVAAGLSCNVTIPSTQQSYFIDSDVPYLSLGKIKVTNTQGISNVHSLDFYFKSNGDSITENYKNNCQGNLNEVVGLNPTKIVNSFDSGIISSVCKNNNVIENAIPLPTYYGEAQYTCPSGGRISSSAMMYGDYINPTTGQNVYGNYCISNYYNTYNYSTIDYGFKAKIDKSNIGIAAKNIETEADSQYRVTGEFITPLEDLVVASGGIRISNNVEADLMPFLTPLEGDVVINNGETLTLNSGSERRYNSLTINSGGKIIIRGTNPVKIYAKKYIINNGSIESVPEINNYFELLFGPFILLDGDRVSYKIPTINAGGRGGNGGEYWGPIYNYGGSAYYGNGGGGGSWVRWDGGASSSVNCGGSGRWAGWGANSWSPGGCVGSNNDAMFTPSPAGGGGGGGARGQSSNAIFVVTPEYSGSGKIIMKGQNGGNGTNAMIPLWSDYNSCQQQITSNPGQYIWINNYCYSFTGGGGGGGGAGGSGGLIYLKIANQPDFKYTVAGGSGGKGGLSQIGYIPYNGTDGSKGNKGSLIIDDLNYYAKQTFDELNLTSADTNNIDTYSGVYPIKSVRTVRNVYHFDFNFKARSNSTKIELFQYLPNTSGYFDNIQVKKISPNAGPPVIPNGSVANYQGIDGFGYFDMPTVPTAELTTIGYDPDTYEPLPGSTWSTVFSDLNAECPIFYNKLQTQFLTSLLAYDQNDDQCDDISISQDPNQIITWKNIGLDRKLEFGYETISCKIDNCPVQNVVQTFEKILSDINISLGISGTQQGEGLIFTYDYNSAVLESNVGQAGYPGANDIPVYRNDRICAKIQDATNEAVTSEFAANPSVNFKRYQWQALKVSGENAAPKSPTISNKRIHLFKKIDSSVRYLLKQELL